jgi:protein-S-isoprenylcysteine O-methyltransferase Ste14
MGVAQQAPRTEMDDQPAAPAVHQDSLLTEWLLRAFVLLVYGWFVWSMGQAWHAEPGRWTLLGLIVTESITLLIVMFARRATVRDMAPMSVLSTVYACSFVLWVTPNGTTAYINEGVGLATQVVGMTLQLVAKLALGRSFGLLPAARGIVTRGPYRWVRHPIYSGYLIAHIGFLASNFSLRNLLVLASLYVAQVWRMHREEAVLVADASYASYASRVRWRLIPGLY